MANLIGKVWALSAENSSSSCNIDTQIRCSGKK